MSGPDLSSLGERIRTLLFNREALAGDSAAASAGAPSKAQGPAEFSTYLKTLAHEYGQLPLGRLQILGFQALRDQMGDHWPQFEQRVTDVIETTFRRRLRPADMFRHYGDLVYLVIFTGLSPDEARLKAYFIAEEIWQQLFGMSEGDERLDVSVLTINLDAQAVEPLSDLDDILTRQFAAAAGDAAALSDDLPWLPSSPQKASSPQREGAPRPDRAPAAVPAPRQQPAPPPAAPRSAGCSPLTFTPLWAVHRNAVSSYHARMRLILGPRDVLYGHDILRRATAPRDTYEFDLATFVRVHVEVQRLGQRRAPTALICPVHYTTIMNREARQELLNLSASLPRAAIRHLIFEISGFPEGFPPHTAYEIRQWLRPFSRAAWAQIPPLPAAVRNIKEAGFSAVGFDARQVAASRFRFIAGLFATAARKSRMRCYIHNISTPVAARTAVDLGFDLLSGDAIQRPLDKVLPPYHLSLDEIAPQPDS